MWLAALNMSGLSYQTDEMILPIGVHILGPRVAQNLGEFSSNFAGLVSSYVAHFFSYNSGSHTE